MANLNESSLRLFTEIRRYPSGISLLGSMLSSEELSVHSAAIFLSEAEAAAGGICSRSLTTSSSPTKVISVAAFLASSTGTFFCFWTPLNCDSFFYYFCSVRTVYVRFFLLSTWPCTRDSTVVNTNSEMTMQPGLTSVEK